MNPTFIFILMLACGFVQAAFAQTQPFKNPTSTLQMTATTTAYTAGQRIAANPDVIPSVSIASSANASIVPRLRLFINDPTSTAWGGQTIQIDLWTAAPTMVGGDRAAWKVSTGSKYHAGAFTCSMSAVQTDGVYGECSSVVPPVSIPAAQSGGLLYWTAQATTGSGVTGASAVMTLTLEQVNGN